MLALLFFTVAGIFLCVLFPLLQHLVFVGAGYSAKAMCSGIFLSSRSYDSIFENELAVGQSNLFIGVRVNREEQSVTSSIFGLEPHLSKMLYLPVRKAIFLGPTFGCQLEIESMTSKHPSINKNRDADKLTAGDAAIAPADHNSIDINCIRRVLSDDFNPEAARRNQSRAIAVSHRGEIVAEGYQESMGISAETPLLGWSMTKSVFSMVVGVAVQQEVVELETPLRLLHLNATEKRRLKRLNRNRELTFRDLLVMADVLGMAEDYGIMKEVVMMLYGSHDMVEYIAGVATHSQQAPPSSLTDAPVSSFAWYYSSAVSNLLSLELRSRFPSDEKYWSFPRDFLFEKIGASSFALELDPSGSFVASSFGFGTAREWTRLGELLLLRGAWRGEQLLPEWYVDFMQQPNPASGGHYGGHIWLNPARVSVEEYNRLPLDHPKKVQCQWMTRSLPPDAFYMSGHDGQFVFIVPSKELVVTRLGFTHDKGGSLGYDGWDTERFFSTIISTCSRQ